MGKKQVHKTKEELIAGLKKNAEFNKKMDFVRNTFYPALCKASMNVEDAQILLTGMNSMIMQEFLGLMKEKTINDLHLTDKLDQNNPKFFEMSALLGIFADQTVFDAKDSIEGMRGEIGIFISDEMKERKLEDLKTKWVDQL